MSPPRLVILDTDPGVDDALALLYLRAHPELKLLALTTVFGNADIETTTRNALYLRDRFTPGIPVYRGADAPLARPRGPSPVHVHGHNGLGDIDLADPRPSEPDAGVAHQRMIALVRAHPGQVTLLAIGPLTNLAKALRDAPDIVRLVAEVVVMGGAFGQGAPGGNITPFAEANIYNDPEAAMEVLAAPWPVTLIGLDVTTRCVLSNAQADDLAKRGGAPGRFASEVSRHYAAAYGRFEGLDGCCLHDVAAVAFILRRDLFAIRRDPIKVTLDGERLGQTSWAKQGPAHNVAVNACSDEVVKGFVEALYLLGSQQTSRTSADS